jgi:hypothetical protein
LEKVSRNILECKYTYNGRSTTVRLNSNREFISADGDGVESLNFALELQNCLNTPLRAFDDGYNFDVDLSNVKTIDEFLRKMDEPLPE